MKYICNPASLCSVDIVELKKKKIWCSIMNNNNNDNIFKKKNIVLFQYTDDTCPYLEVGPQLRGPFPSHCVNLLFILFRPILFVCRIAFQGLGWDYVVLPSSGASTPNSHRLSSLPLNTLQHKSSADAFWPRRKLGCFLLRFAPRMRRRAALPACGS